ncbi:unnamed protein product [Xylocopa violacea]|uniref:Connectin n=1 Tax=Xylocopa violacea TaxID=135666 RepID=A0ABP1NEN5_XYLVO
MENEKKMRYYRHFSRNRLICDCKLTWIWGLRNETKNTKLRESLEKLTCLLESNNVTLDNDELGWPETLNSEQNSEEYRGERYRGGSIEDDDAYMDDVYENKDGYDDSSLNSDFQLKTQMVDGKLCYVKNLFDLKLEDLPCPEPSREDLMASEQPSSRHENAYVSSSGSIWSSSSPALARLDLSVLLYSVLLLLSVLFT